MSLSNYATVMGPIAANTPVNITSLQTQTDLLIPAGDNVIRVCVFIPITSSVSAGCGMQLGDTDSVSKYIQTSDGLTTTLLNSNFAYNKCVMSHVAPSSPMPMCVQFDQDFTDGTIWFEITITANQY